MSTPLKFVTASLEDMDYLLALRKNTMVEHLKSSGIVYNDEQHKARILDCFDCVHLIYRNDGCVGAIKYHVGDSRIDIMQLQVDPNFQNQGIGGQVVKQIFATHPDVDCYLTVLKFNPAKGLYVRLGFEQYGEDELEFHMRCLGKNDNCA